jgi:2-polyprenyl-3-methyl-5-hydroxy-6-metoxy-1,4-benzoquinol methylase
MPKFEGIEYIRCNLCGADNTRLLFKLPVRPQHVGVFNRDIWDIVRCQECGLIYENPRADTVARDYYYTFDNAGDFAFVQDWFLDNADFNRSTCKQILRAIHHHHPAGKLLDVGCGTGNFLTEAQKAGFDVSGQDVSPYFVEYCRTHYDFQVYSGELETLNLPESSFDCITSFDVIEHVRYPKQLLKEMRRLVKPGGLVVVGTHDIGNLFARLYGVNWRHMGAMGHITYFTRQTLARMMQECELTIVQTSGGHTVDGNKLAEIGNYVTKFFRVIVFRSLILYIYKPITSRIPALTHWSLHLGEATLNHQKLLMRAGKQVVMNDNMVLLAVPK